MTERLRAACDTNDVDSSRQFGRKEAEASPVRAYHTAGEPALAGPGSFVGGGQLSVRTERLGLRCKDHIHGNDHADEFDVANAGLGSAGSSRSALCLKASRHVGLRMPG